LSGCEISGARAEKKLVEPLLDKLLGEDIEVELLAGDSQFESGEVFDVLNARKMDYVIPWRRLKGRVNHCETLSVKDRIDVEDPEHLRVAYKMLKVKSESLNGLQQTHIAKPQKRLRPRVPGLLCHLLSSYCCIALGKPELQYSIAYFA
jgi:hypothetical protein